MGTSLWTKLKSNWELKLSLIFWCVLSHFSQVPCFGNPWTVACQAPLSIAFSRQGYWSGLPCHPLLYQGIESTSLTSPVLAGRFFTTSTTWEALFPDGSQKVDNGSIAAPIKDDYKRQCWWQIFPVGRISSSTTCYSFCLEGEMTRDVTLPRLWTVALQIQLSDEVFWNYKVYYSYWNSIVSLNILFLHVY